MLLWPTVNTLKEVLIKIQSLGSVLCMKYMVSMVRIYSVSANEVEYFHSKH